MISPIRTSAALLLVLAAGCGVRGAPRSPISETRPAAGDPNMVRTGGGTPPPNTGMQHNPSEPPPASMTQPTTETTDAGTVP